MLNQERSRLGAHDRKANRMSGPKSIPDDAGVYQLGRKPETTAQRVHRLQVEAQMLAREQIDSLEQAMRAAAELAAEIAQGGDAYPAGVRELADRIAEDLPAKAQTLQLLIDRIPEPKL
jgi:hypothetical protein